MESQKTRSKGIGLNADSMKSFNLQTSNCYPGLLINANEYIHILRDTCFCDKT